MGQLDEAIREHLELKRKHGADAEEVARLEREALSPAVREPAVTGVLDTPVADVAPVHEAPTTVAPAPAPAATESPAPAPPASDPAQPTVAYDVHAPSDEPAAGPQALEEDYHLADEIFAPDPPPAAPDDVLDQTPEFLQETPEHDRLWFEQKPPRDFDFDD